MDDSVDENVEALGRPEADFQAGFVDQDVGGAGHQIARVLRSLICSPRREAHRVPHERVQYLFELPQFSWLRNLLDNVSKGALDDNAHLAICGLHVLCARKSL